MSKNRKRNNPVLLRLSDEEMTLLQEKMETAGVKNREAYLRKMALDGYIIKQDFANVKDAVYHLNRIGNNVNQMTKMAHTYGDIELSELKSIKKEMEKVWELLSSKV